MISIRLARAEELEELAAVELDAVESLVEAGVRFPNGVTATPRPVLESALTDALLFVATDSDDRLVGFLAADQRDGGLYVGEIDVARAWQRRGIGRTLMVAAIGEARTRRLWGAMLTTDRFVAFNAPFYASLGFREVAPDAAPPSLARVLRAEIAGGGDPARRVGMVLRFGDG